MGEPERRRRRNRPTAPSTNHDPGAAIAETSAVTDPAVTDPAVTDPAVTDPLDDDPVVPQPGPGWGPNLAAKLPGRPVDSRPIVGPRPPRLPPGAPAPAAPTPPMPDDFASRLASGAGPARPVWGGGLVRPVPGGPPGVGGPVSVAGVSARPTSGAGTGSRFGDEREVERGLRGLVGSGSSQVSVSAALRARDAARPTEDDLAEAEEQLVIVQRNWQPREDLPHR